MSTPCRPICLAIAVAGFGLGLLLAASHPVQPILAAALFLVCAPLFAWRPWFGVLALPALLPILNFSPWTGWLTLDEFDLLILAVVSGGYFRMWRDRSEPSHAKTVVFLFVAAAWLAGRALSDAVSLHDLNWFSGPMTPLNGLRVGKSLLWVALLLPLAVVSIRAPSPGMPARFLWASLLGSVWVVLAVIWERAFFPGLLDFATPYRTVGMFWEMHHGGAALDVYLVLIAPIVVWAWRRTDSSRMRAILGVFILAFAYTCLTTFSRGVVFAASGAVTLQWILLRQQERRSGRGTRPMRLSSVVVIALLCVEASVVLGSDSFLNSRLRETESDLGGRLAHWKRGIGLLESPADWLVGIGPGQLPSRLRYVEGGPGGTGGIETGIDPGSRSGLRLYGPEPVDGGRFRGSDFAISQRFDVVRGDSYSFAMSARSAHGGVVLAQICASHLLYPARCSGRIIDVTGTGWRIHRVDFPGSVFGEGPRWRDVAHGVLLLSALTPGSIVEVESAHLDAGGKELLENPRFKNGEGRWFPQSFRYFVPWHIDNLYLELLIETGVLGLSAFLAVVVRGVALLLPKGSGGETFSITLLSSIAGLLAIGLVVSVIDMPRVSTLCGLFIVWAALAGSERQPRKKLF